MGVLDYQKHMCTANMREKSTILLRMTGDTFRSKKIYIKLFMEVSYFACTGFIFSKKFHNRYVVLKILAQITTEVRFIVTKWRGFKLYKLKYLNKLPLLVPFKNCKNMAN